MRYCPTCQAHFEGDEIYCPHDGTRLQSETTHRPGRLAGTSLSGKVNLEAFLFADHLGERYRGRLLANNQEVRITVFHRRFDQERVDKTREILAPLDSGLPSEVLATLSLEDQGSPRFLIEEQAQRETLSHLLKKKGPLSWEQALFLTIRLARVMEWLGERGIHHRAIHPRSIFVDNPKSASIQVGELAVGLLSFPLPPLEEDTPVNAIPIYPGFLAPEWCDPEAKPTADQTTVFAMGAVLLTSLGAPLVTEETFKEQSLSEWIAAKERPKISLDLPGEAPAALEELANILVDPDPTRRFQTPQAAIRALAGLLKMDPDKIAPPLEIKAPVPAASPSKTQTQVLPFPAADEQTADGENEVVSVSKTQIGMPVPQALISDHEPPVEDEPPAKEDKQEETVREEPVFDGKKTLLMGAVTVEDISAQAAKEAAAPAEKAQKDEQTQEEMSQSESAELTERDNDSSVVPNDKTGDDQEKAEEPSVVVSMDSEPEAGEEAPEKEPLPSIIIAEDDEPEPEKQDDDPAEQAEPSIIVSTAGESADAESESSIIIDDSLANESSAQDDTDGKEDAAQEKAAAPKAVKSSKGKKKTKKTTMKGRKEKAREKDEKKEVVQTAQDDTPEAEKDDPEVEDVDEKEQPQEEEESAREEKKDLQIGFVQARQSSESDEFADDWFSRSTEDAWEDSLVREAQARSERNEKFIRIGLVAALILVGFGVVIFTLNYEPEEVVSEPEKSTGWTRQVAEVDVEELRGRFDDAMENQRLTHPRDTSALTALRELRRHAEKDVYDDARKRFVSAADELSRTYERLGDLHMAHVLAGYASEYDAENKELRARAEAMRDAFFEARDRVEESESSDDEGSVEDDDEAAADGIVVASNAPSAPARSAQSAPVVNLSDLLKQAAAAYDASEFEQAEAFYRQVVAQSPNHVEANSRLAQIYFDRADHQQALGYQQTAVNQAPRDVNHRLQLGMIHYRLTQYDEAIKVWEEVLSMEPGNRTAERFIELAQRSMSSNN